MDRARGGRRGGARQRATRHAEVAQLAGALGGSSELAYYLVSEVFSGRLSAPFAKTIATLAQRDIRRAQNAGPEFEFVDLNIVAGIKKGNEYETLKSKITPPLVSVRSIQVPLKINFSVKRVTDYPIVWPHELFSGLFHNYKSEWESRVVPDKNMLPTFWEALAGHPMLRIHPMVTEDRWNEVFIGIAFMSALPTKLNWRYIGIAFMIILVIQYDSITHVRVIWMRTCENHNTALASSYR